MQVVDDVTVCCFLGFNSSFPSAAVVYLVVSTPVICLFLGNCHIGYPQCLCNDVSLIDFYYSLIA